MIYHLFISFTIMKINEIWSYMTKRDDASIQCRFCGKIFNCTIKPSIHEKNHAFTKITIEQFNLEEDLLQHLLANHNEEDDKIKVSLIDRKRSAEIKERAKGSSVWEYFTKSENEPGRAECNICQISLSILFYRNKNGRSSSRPETTTGNWGSLYNHLKAKHALFGAKNFLCSHCGKQFSRKSLKNECEAKHVGDARLKCSYDGCSMQFTKVQSVKKHISAVHKKLKPHICEQCGRSFAERQHLKTHLRVHTGETPFECDKCQKKFKFHATRNSHKCVADAVR